MAALAIELSGLSWVQKNLGAWDGEGGGSGERQQVGREETPPRPAGYDVGGGVGMRRHGDLGFAGFLRPPLLDLPSRSHRMALRKSG